MRELSPDSTTSGDDEISLISLANALLRWRRTIFAFAVVGAAAGLAAGLLSRRTYASTATFSPQVGNEQSASAGLALAASQFGLRIPGSGGGWPAATYVELLSSRALLDPIARDTFVVAEDGNRRVALMDLLEVQADNPAQRVEKTIRKLRTLVTAIEVKKLGAVQMTVATRWPSVSLGLANRLLEGVNRFNTQTRQSQATAERKFVEKQAQDAERALRDAEDRMQGFLQRNRVASSPDLVFERDRLQREITLRQQSYTTLLQSHEEARIREVRDTPVITVLESPVFDAIGESRHTAVKAVLGAVVGIVLAVLFRAIAGASQSPSEDMKAFFQTLDEAMPRFFRRRRFDAR